MSIFGMTGMFRILAFAFLSLFIVVAVIIGAYTFITTGNAHPLAKATGGLVFDSDSDIYRNVDRLSNKTIFEEYPELFDQQTIDAYTEQIIKGLFMLFVVWFFLFKILQKLSGLKQFDFFNTLMMMGLAILIMMLLQVVWVAMTYPDHPLIVPFRGVISLAQHPDVLSRIPQTIERKLGLDTLNTDSNITVSNITNGDMSNFTG